MSAKSAASFLENLSLVDLNEIMVCADVLIAAGTAVEQRGFQPAFEMVPGRWLTMRVDVKFLPDHAVADAPAFVATGPDITVIENIALSAGDQVTSAALAALDETHWASEAPPPADDADAALPSSRGAAPVSPPDVQSIGRADVAPADKPGRAPRWTEEEDEIVIAAVAQAKYYNEPIGRVIRALAEQLGRPVPGTEFRAKDTLKNRIAARVQAIAEHVAATQAVQVVEPTETEQAAEAATEEPDQGSVIAEQPVVNALVQGVATADAAAPEVRLEPIPSAPPVTVPIEIWQHLQQVPRSNLWTLQADRDLMNSVCAGIPLHVIADEFDMKASAIEGRFDILTNRRTFRRERVLTVLEYMLDERSAQQAAE